MRNRLNQNTYQSNRLVDVALQSQPAGLPAPPCRHILLPLGETGGERSAAMTALHLGALLRAQVTFLQVCSPPAEHSLHWLDAIDQLHERLSTRNRGWGPDDRNGSLQTAQTTVVEWLKQTVPESLRNQVEICIEVRFGDLAREVARYAEGKTVDLLILSRVTSRWGRRILPRPARRILRSTRTPAILVAPDPQQMDGVAPRSA